eukprot:gene1481-2109_t
MSFCGFILGTYMLQGTYGYRFEAADAAGNIGVALLKVTVVEEAAGIADLLNNELSPSIETVAATDVDITDAVITEETEEEEDEESNAEYSLAVSFTTIVAVADGASLRLRRSLLDLAESTDEVEALLRAAAADGRMSDSIGRAAVVRNVTTLPTEVSGLVGEATSVRVSPEVDNMAAYSSGLEGSMERLEESNAMLAVHLEQHVQPSVEAAGGNADEWTERLMKSWVDAQRGEQTNQESLLETTHELEERFGKLRGAEELVREGLLEAELAMQESVRQSDEVLETSYAATDAAILLQGKRPGADTAGCRLQSLNTGKVRDNQLLRFHFTVGAANNVTSDMIEQGLRRRLADNLNQDAIQSGGDQAIYEKHRWWKMPSSSEVDEFDTSSSINTLTRRLLIGKHAVVGGILCHVTRKKDDRNKPCTKRFEHIGAPCFTQPVFGTYFGRDTIFTPGATLYRADLQEDMWKYYNTSAGSVMLDEFTGRPHAFWPRHLPGYGVGYPFYIDTRLNERRAQEMYTYIEEGLLIDQSTDEISANLVTWNSQLQSFGLMRLMWHRVNRGDFQVRYQVWNLKVTYWNVDSAWDAFYLLVNIAWISLSVSSFFRELAKLRPEALARRRSVYSRYLHKLKPHLSATLRLLALASATLQMIVVMLFVGYHYLMLHALHVDRHYHVYHSLHALANLFLSPRRLGPAAGGKEAEGADSVASLEEEGAALLWALPEDNHGLETYAHRLQEINLAGRLHQSVYTVQACWVLIMIPQLCLTLEQQPSFQRIVKALSIYGKAAALNVDHGEEMTGKKWVEIRKSAQYFSEVVPFFVALGAFSVLFHITFGLKLETYHTFTRSLNRLSLFSFLKKYHVRTVGRTRPNES